MPMSLATSSTKVVWSAADNEPRQTRRAERCFEIGRECYSVLLDRGCHDECVTGSASTRQLVARS